MAVPMERLNQNHVERIPSTSSESRHELIEYPYQKQDDRKNFWSPLRFLKNNYGAIIFIIFAIGVLLLGRFVADWKFGWKGWTALAIIFTAFLAMLKSISDPEWILLAAMCAMITIVPKDPIITGILSSFH